MHALTATALPLAETSRPGIWCVLRKWHQNTRTRRQLAELDSRQLADIGVSPSERVGEISKPFWR